METKIAPFPDLRGLGNEFARPWSWWYRRCHWTGRAYAPARTMVNALLYLVLLPPILLPAAQRQDKTTWPARNPVEGAKTFRYYCAACHGADGRGHGPASVALKHAVPDLTLLSQRSGGKFPYQHVKEIIEGKEPGPLAHGDREMPIWGPIFHEVESDEDWGEVRLEAVTKHVESIQQK
jgi:mono/diheme cytochrome c family protein